MKIRHKLILDYYVGGLLHVLLRLPTMLLGKLLRRDHRLSTQDEVVFVKFLGGGSLVIAYPSLLALRAAGRRLTLVTTSGIKPFAETLGVFDRVLVIRDTGLFTLASDSLTTIWKLRRCPVLVDLEIHSRFSTVFCLLTCARNRISFYSLTAFWRRNLATHLLYYNGHAPVYLFYDQVSTLLRAAPLSFAETRRAFREGLLTRVPATALAPDVRHIGVAATCSNLSVERMLRIDEWCAIIASRIPADAGVCLHLLGAPSDREQLDELGAAVRRAMPGIEVVNHAGACTLIQSVRLVAQLERLLAIDSALLHFARLLEIPVESWWGPTNPALLLRDLKPGESHYRALSCSPCIHVTGDRPCHGDNRCMRAAAASDTASDLNPLWLLAPGDPSASVASPPPSRQ